MTAGVRAAVEFRCPVGAGGMFLRLLRTGDARIDTGANLIEVACRECARRRRQLGHRCAAVLHRFGLDGVVVETLVV